MSQFPNSFAFQIDPPGKPEFDVDPIHRSCSAGLLLVQLTGRFLMQFNRVNELKNIKVLGSGCRNCENTANVIAAAFRQPVVGDAIRKGEPVGNVGMTGYANGYHLHWELMVGGVPVEPFEWTKNVF